MIARLLRWAVPDHPTYWLDTSGDYLHDMVDAVLALQRELRRMDAR